MLEQEYQRNPNWDLQHTKQLAERFGLTRVKVYKWHYDRKRLDLSRQSSEVPAAQQSDNNEP